MKTITAFLIGICLGLAFRLSFDAFNQSHTGGHEPFVIHDTTYDTIQYRMPVPYDSAVIRYITKTISVTKDSVIRHSEDSLSVTVPITQKQYKDSTYTAWVSGYEANLDSINVYQKTHTQTVFQPTYINQKRKSWGLGIQVGAGMTPNKIQPYIGVGVSYNVFSW